MGGTVAPVKALVALALGMLALALAALVAVVALGGDGGTTTSPAPSPYAGSRPPEGVVLPSFTLTDEAGRRVASDELRGSVVLVTFLDTQCTDACPVVAGEHARAVDALTPSERERVRVLGITVDPIEDTPASVDAFLARHHAEGRLSYLTAPVAQMETLWKAFAILPTARSGDDSLHSIPVQVYDPTGEWRSTLTTGVDLTRRNVLHDVRLAFAEGS